jgi:hypothetical protein
MTNLPNTVFTRLASASASARGSTLTVGRRHREMNSIHFLGRDT